MQAAAALVESAGFLTGALVVAVVVTIRVTISKAYLKIM